MARSIGDQIGAAMIDNVTAFVHSATCVLLSANYERLRAAFGLYWPDYCQTCNGLGGSFYHYDPSPGGVSLGSGFMVEFDECPDCIEQGKCPRCGKIDYWHSWMEDDPMICPNCEWNSEHAERLHNYVSLTGNKKEIQQQCVDAFDMHAIPEKPECYCHENEGWGVSRG
jgi:hypothetical protein